jgi:hypothetical protein
MGTTTTILLVDSSIKRRGNLAQGIAGACEVIARDGLAVTFRSEKAEWSNWDQYHIVVLHNNDRGDLSGMDLSMEAGPRVVKFGGGGQEEAVGECRSRVYAIYPPIPPGGPYGAFEQSEVWSKILRFVFDPKSCDKPPELLARPVDPLIVAVWLLLKGYALARGFADQQELASLATNASRRWSGFSPSEKAGYWKPVAGGAGALADAKLSQASALVADIQTNGEPEKESVLAAVKEVGEFLRRKGFCQQ